MFVNVRFDYQHPSQMFAPSCHDIQEEPIHHALIATLQETTEAVIVTRPLLRVADCVVFLPCMRHASGRGEHFAVFSIHIRDTN